MIDLDLHLPAIASADPLAFGRWMAGAEHHLRAHLSSFARQVDVEAVLQETLLRVWQVAPRVATDGKGNSLLRLALRTARNLALDEVRRKRPTLVDTDTLMALSDRDVHAPEPPDPALREAIAACHRELPDAPRTALDARVGPFQPDRELADRAGMTLNTFHKNVGRARRLLLACLGRHGIVLTGVSP